jgi:hypothetical protein
VGERYGVKVKGRKGKCEPEEKGDKRQRGRNIRDIGNEGKGNGKGKRYVKKVKGRKEKGD